MEVSGIFSPHRKEDEPRAQRPAAATAVGQPKARQVPTAIRCLSTIKDSFALADSRPERGDVFVTLVVVLAGEALEVA